MNTRIKHIYWFAPYGPVCPSTRYRGIKPLQHIESLGINYDLISPERSLKRIFKFLLLYIEILFFRKANSGILVQKVYSNGFYANALKLLIKIRNKHTVYDLDDAEQYRRKTKTLVFFLTHCEKVSVGSQFLKDYCEKYNDQVFLQTSPVPYTPEAIKNKKNDKLHLGWVGDFGNGNSVSKSFSHKANLYALFFPVLKKITYPIKLSLIGVKNPQDIPEIKDYFQDCPHIELVIPVDLDWRDDSWLYPKIAEFDLGISLMLDHPFNQAKSAFKAKQYLVCGVPVLANDIGETQFFVQDKVNGYICNTDTAVLNSIHQIHNMDDFEYNELSKRCLQNISTFSMDRYGKILLENM